MSALHHAGGGLLGGREFELCLVALRAGPARPREAATRVGVPAAVMRPRICRWLQDPRRARLVRRDGGGCYRLTPVGARVADEAVRQVRLTFRGQQAS